MYRDFGEDPQTWTPPESPAPPRRPGAPLPYREAVEAHERKLMADYARDCAGRRLLERLERNPGTAADRVKRFERRLAGIPRLFEMKRALDVRLAELRAKLSRGEIASDRFHYERARIEGDFRAMIEREFGPGYALGSEAEELANARCALSKARWELATKDRTGRVPGRLHGGEGGRGLGQPIQVSEDAFIQQELAKGTPAAEIANRVFWMRFPAWNGVRLPKDCAELTRLHTEWRRAHTIVQYRQTLARIRVP